MNNLLFMAEIWRERKALSWPLVGIPALALLLAAAQGERYTAVATLQLDSSKATSPLLSTITEPAQVRVLESIAKNPDVLADAARDSGTRLSPRDVNLVAMNERLIQLSATSHTPQGLENALDALAYTFITELLAPERLRLEQRLGHVQDSLTQIQKQLENPTLAADERGALDIKKTVAEQAYQTLLGQVESINAAFQGGPGGNPQAVLWFAEPAHIASRPHPLKYYLCAGLMGLLAGVGGALVMLFWKRASRQSPVSETELSALTGLNVLGSLPNIGRVTLGPEGARVHVGTTTLDPSAFTEIQRLHRALTRGTHGSIALCGTHSGEGSTLMAALLALRSAQSGKRTLLIDLNLKSGTLTQMMGLEGQSWNLGKRGGKDALKGTVVDLGASWSGLHILPLPNGPATLGELAQGGLLADMLGRLKDMYDHVWLDTSPISATNRGNIDALSVCAAASRTAMVVKLRDTPSSSIKAATDALLNSGAHLAGLVANNVANPSPRQLLLHLASRMQRFAPGYAARLKAQVLHSELS